MKTLNFNSRQIISKEELIDFDYSLRELVGNILSYNSVSGRGIVDYIGDSSTLLNGFFEPALGTNTVGGYDSLKISAGIGVLNTRVGVIYDKISGLSKPNLSLANSGAVMFNWPATDNIDTGVGAYSEGDIIKVGFIPVYNPMEDGLCAISSTGQVTISGGNFDNVRDQSFKNPSKISFYNQDGTPATNNGIYEVISKIDSTTLLISGSLSSESDIKLVIVGSYDLGVYGDLSDKTSYSVINGELLFTLSETDITGVGGFLICELVVGTAGAFTIVDKRSLNLFTFATSPDTMYKSIEQTVTGKKTFETSSPEFGVAVIEKFHESSISTPISLGTGNITLPDNENGSIFTIKASPGSSTLNRIFTTKALFKGEKLYIKVDSTGMDVNVLSINSASGILPNDTDLADFDGTNYSYVIKAGAILEIVADTNFCWRIMNTGVTTKANPPWILATGLTDSGGTPISSVDNVIYYKKDNNVVYIQIASITEASVHFTLPAGYRPTYALEMVAGVSGILYIEPDGTVGWYASISEPQQQFSFHI